MSQAATDRASLFSVEGTVAVITGGGSGLGANMALALDVRTESSRHIIGRNEANRITNSDI